MTKKAAKKSITKTTVAASTDGKVMTDTPKAKAVPAQDVAPADTPKKAKRVSLNPQHIIDKKTEALKAKGFNLIYKDRKWCVGDRTFTSLEFSKYTVEEFANLF